MTGVSEPAVRGRTAVIIAAAGQGFALGAEGPKAFVQVGGLSLLQHCVTTMLASQVELVVVAVPLSMVAEVESQTRGQAMVVVGGSTRHETVVRALAVLPPEVDVVLVHDAARALTPVWLVDAVLGAVRAGAPAVVPALPVADTVKRVVGDRVVETLDRSALRSVQTPQGFRRDVLAAAYDSCGEVRTDDAGVVEAAGVDVRVIAGAPEAFKITTPFDLVIAEALHAR